MIKLNIPKPTGEQCDQHSKVHEDERTIGYAIWYPQMGGYVGIAVALIDKHLGVDECFEVLVWHDGEFPFDGEGGDNPRRLHHCMAEHFIRFGNAIEALQSRKPE